MKSIYAVFSYYRSPIYTTYPKAVAAFSTAKEAKEFVKLKREKAVRNKYMYMRVPFVEHLHK